jgi:hypothetical protein
MTQAEKPSRFKTFVTSIDVWGRPIQLCFKGKPVFKTTTGGGLTIFTAMAVIGLLIFQLFTLTSRKNYTTTTIETYSENPPSLNLAELTMMFAVGHYDLQHGVNQTNAMYNFTLSYVSATVSNTGVTTQNITSIELKPCTFSHFATNDPIVSSSLNTSYQANALNQFLCPSSVNFSLFGAQSSNTYSYFELQVNPCVNSSVTKCASPAFAANYITVQPHIAIKVFFLNTAVDVSDFQNPIKYFIQEEIWYYTAGLQVLTEIEISALSVISSDNYFGLGDDQNKTVANYQDDRQDRVYQTIAPTSPIWINIRPAATVTTVMRTYMTIANVLSSVGGIWNILFLVLGFAAGIANKKRFQVELAAEIIGLNPDHHRHHRHQKHNNTRGHGPLSRLKSFASFLNAKKSQDVGTEVPDKPSTEEELLTKAMQHVDQEIELAQILKRLKTVEDALNKPPDKIGPDSGSTSPMSSNFNNNTKNIPKDKTQYKDIVQENKDVDHNNEIKIEVENSGRELSPLLNNEANDKEDNNTNASRKPNDSISFGEAESNQNKPKLDKIALEMQTVNSRKQKTESSYPPSVGEETGEDHAQ